MPEQLLTLKCTATLMMNGTADVAFHEGGVYQEIKHYGDGPGILLMDDLGFEHVVTNDDWGSKFEKI